MLKRALPAVPVALVALMVGCVTASADGSGGAQGDVAAGRAVVTATLTGPSRIVVGAAAVHWTATVTVPGADDGGHYAGGHVGVFYSLDRLRTECNFQVSGSAKFAGHGTWKVSAYLGRGQSDGPHLTNACATKVHLGVSIVGKADDNVTDVTQTLDTTVRLQRRSRIVGVNASPEPVEKGATVGTTAKIQRMSWDADEYRAYPGQKSVLQFRTTTGSYGKVKTITAKTGGKLTGSAAQSKKGCWRFTFAGVTTTAAATSAGDCVSLKH